MHINPIQFDISTNNNKSKTIRFKALSPDIIKNQMRIYLCQDIFAERLKIKLPQTNLEKEVLLEILQNRLQLNKLVRLANEKMRIKTQLNEACNLLETNPESPRLEELKNELAKRGNLEATCETISKGIEKEKKIKRIPIEYFANISALQDEYYAKHLISSAKVDRFIKDVKVGNINKDGKYSVQELIDIIKNSSFAEKNTEVPKNIQKPKLNLNKDRFISLLSSDYEDYIRQHVNMYRGKNTSIGVIEPMANNYVLEKYADYFKKFPELQKYLKKICSTINIKYLKKIHRFGEVDIYGLERIFKELDNVLSTIKNLDSEIKLLQKQSETDKSENLKQLLINKKAQFLANKIEWSELLETTMEAEKENQRRISSAGFANEYEYLTAKNIELNKFRKLYQTLKENKNSLPEEAWESILR